MATSLRCFMEVTSVRPSHDRCKDLHVQRHYVSECWCCVGGRGGRGMLNLAPAVWLPRCAQSATAGAGPGGALALSSTRARLLFLGASHHNCSLFVSLRLANRLFPSLWPWTRGFPGLRHADPNGDGFALWLCTFALEDLQAQLGGLPMGLGCKGQGWRPICDAAAAAAGAAAAALKHARAG